MKLWFRRKRGKAARPLGLAAQLKMQKEPTRSPWENIEAFRLRRSGCDPRSLRSRKSRWML